MESSSEILEADRVYILMKSDYPISRNIRAHWYFSHLNCNITVPRRTSFSDFKSDIQCNHLFEGGRLERQCLNSELELISVVPKEPPPDWDWDTAHLYCYHISHNTQVSFLARRYRLAYLLDMSPSASAVNVHSCSVLIDQMLPALKASLEGVVRPFFVPGSQLLFYPEIYITVIAWSPFLTAHSKIVLNQGWLLTPENLDEFMDIISKEFKLLEKQASEAAAKLSEDLENLKNDSERLVGDLFEEHEFNRGCSITVPIVAPDNGFISMLHNGILALKLLPGNSSAGLIVITDGIVSIPDNNLFESLLNRFRTNTIACSFILIGSVYRPQNCFGMISYKEIMEFMSLATYGAFIPMVLEIEKSEPYIYDMNIYHRAILAWNFRKALEVLCDRKHKFAFSGNTLPVNNPSFYQIEMENLYKNKHFEMNLNTSLSAVLSCRLREGYTVKEMRILSDNYLEVWLTLPWKYSTFIHYIIKSNWPPAVSEQPKVRVEVSIEGTYQLLHDIFFCERDHQFSSPYRQGTIKQYSNTIQQLMQHDKLLVHLHSFALNPAHYSIPDCVRSGNPLFTFQKDSMMPVLFHQDFPYPQFVSFWKPICMLDITIWQRWLHTNRIGLLLINDHPLPKYLHHTNSNGRYSSVLSRQGQVQLNCLLKEWSSFVLIENHSYIKLNYDDPEKPPVSYLLIRVTAQPPCIVIWLAFLGGTPGHIRYQVENELREKICLLSVKQRVTINDVPESRIISTDSAESEKDSPYSHVKCCILLKKPTEKILIRYERLPHDFNDMLGDCINQSSSFEQKQTIVNYRRSKPQSNSAYLTLSRYLFQKRYIWNIQKSSSTQISTVSVSRILSLICQMRILEGFSFAYSHSGMHNMVKELSMSPQKVKNKLFPEKSQTCILQYIVFPPHAKTHAVNDAASEELENENVVTESDSELELVTEVWIEPQTGLICEDNQHLDFLNRLTYDQVSDAIFPYDYECISNLITFEHLNIMCQKKLIPALYFKHFLGESYMNKERDCLVKENDLNVKKIDFPFDLMKIIDKSSQSEMLFSLLIQNLGHECLNDWERKRLTDFDQANSMLFEILKEEIHQLNDTEVLLSEMDNRLFPTLVNSRKGDKSEHFKVKSCRGDIADGSDKISSILKEGMHSETSCTSCSNGKSHSAKSRNKTSEIEFDIPKWKCFAKSISATHVVITFLPASYLDLKILLLDADSLNNSNPKFVKIVDKPIEEKTEEFPDVLKKFEKISKSHLPGSDLNVDISSPSRNRTSSLDSFSNVRTFNSKVLTEEQQNSLRDRAKSVGSQYYQSDVLNKQIPSNFENVADILMEQNQVYGALSLPIYFYDCSLSNLMNFVLHKKNHDYSQDIYQDFTFDSDNFNDDIVESHQETPKDTEKEEQLELKPQRIFNFKNSSKIMKIHCSYIQKVFFKSFVHALFKALQLNLSVHSDDIQSAIDYCDHESVIDIELSKFLNAICPHHKLIQNNSASFDSDFERENCTKLFASFHDSIKANFDSIIKKSFKLINSSKNLYFYCKNINSQSLSFKINETDDGESFIHLKSNSNISTLCDDEEKKIEIYSQNSNECYDVRIRGQNSTTTENDAFSSSVLSTVDSESDDEPSKQGYFDEYPTEKVKPLFVQMSCSIKFGSSFVTNFSIEDLPTCFTEISKHISQQDKLEPGRIKITLDLLFLSLPQLVEDVLQGDMHNIRTTSFNSNMSSSFHEHLQSALGSSHSTVSSVGNIEDGETDILSHLPKQQRDAVAELTDNIEWLLQDEIVHALSGSKPITEDILKKVVDHINNSFEDKPNCVRNKTPLSFVFGPEKSLNLFFDLLYSKEIKNYRLESEGNFLYILEDFYSNPDENLNSEINETFLNAQCPKDLLHSPDTEKKNDSNFKKTFTERGFCNLSPVKEVRTVSPNMMRASLDESDIASGDEMENRSEISSQIVFEASKSDSDAELSDATEKNDLIPSSNVNLHSFWLILQVDDDAVTTCFHLRETTTPIELIKKWKDLHRFVIKNIINICQIVNQKMLLQDLHDTRICKRLLEQEITDDHWQKADDTASEQFSEAYLEANLKFIPGHFACPEVWETSFILHPRLKTGRPNVSQGMQAIKSVLIPFTVHNHKNLFVYEDDDDKNVFYLKIHENIHANYVVPLSRQASLTPNMKDKHFFAMDSLDEQYTSSRSSSIGSHKQLKFSRSEYIDESNLKKDMQLNDSEKPKDTIILKVHGITPASDKIKVELVNIIQHRLDEKVVELISLMFERNSVCKLSPSDVHFLQKPGIPPTSVVKFTVNSRAIPYLQALYYYLRQNLIQVPLIVPKYTTNDKHFHFKDSNYESRYSRSNAVQNDIFIYNRHHTQSAVGIACISLSLVDGQGNFIQYIGCPKPSCESYKTVIKEEEFAELTQTNIYIDDQEEKNLGPLSLIQFKIWEHGKIDFEKFTNNLKTSVEHSLWDVMMEYHLMTAPLLDEPDEVQKDVFKDGVFEIENHSSSREILNEDSVENISFNDSKSEILSKIRSSEKNNLNFIHRRIMLSWLDYGLDLQVPAVEMKSVQLSNSHPAPLIIKELQSMLHHLVPKLSTKVFQKILQSDNGEAYIPYTKVWSHNVNTKRLEESINYSSNIENDTYIIVGRNFKKWKSSLNESYDPLSISPKNEKIFQKFISLIYNSNEDLNVNTNVSTANTPRSATSFNLESFTGSPKTSSPGSQSNVGIAALLKTNDFVPNVFVPRQQYLYIVISKDNIKIYLYNWSKETSANFFKQSVDLGYWLSARSSLLTSIVCQKLGLFHNQPFACTKTNQQKKWQEKSGKNHFMGNFGSIDLLIKHHAPQDKDLNMSKNESSMFFLDIYRDKMPNSIPKITNLNSERDNLLKHGKQMLQLRYKCRKDLQRKLFSLWQSRGDNSNINLSNDLLLYLKSYSRLLHYVMTPLLFLPSWREQANATRDNKSTYCTEHHAQSDSIENVNLARSRRTSEASIQSEQNPCKIGPTMGNSLHVTRKILDLDWIQSFVNEYVQYLQKMGFVIVKKSAKHSSIIERKKNALFENKEETCVYLQKSFLGGIILFEVSMSEPFFYIILYGIESSRLQQKNLFISPFVSLFIEECEKVKNLIHVHSYAFDYHLRVVHSYVVGRHSIILQGFHLSSFMDDFMKYYHKGPNFARNLIHAGNVEINNCLVPPSQLYNYILSHEKQYGMKVLRMTLCSNEESSNEYILVKLSYYKMTFHEKSEFQRTDDFDVTLLVCNDDSGENVTNTLNLKYYIILTSKRELYPVLATENFKSEKLRTVSIMPTSSYFMKSECNSNTSRKNSLKQDADLLSLILSEQKNEDQDVQADDSQTHDSEPSTQKSRKSVVIQPEVVNYLGYYSSHEETMRSVISEHSNKAEENLKEIVNRAIIHCRRDFLWHKLLLSSKSEEEKKRGDSSKDGELLTYDEFIELLSFATKCSINSFDKRLEPLLKKPISWHQQLYKVLMAKYHDSYRLFNSLDKNSQYIVILNQKYVDAFALLYFDISSKETDLCIVYKDQISTLKAHKEFVHNLIEGFVNACCFHLWSKII